MAATRYEKNLGLGLVVKIDQSEVYDPLQQLQLRQPSVTALALFPLFVLAYLVGRSVYLPLARLKSGTEIVGEGNLDYRVGSQASDEIGALSRSFDRMVNKLEGLNRRVTEANQDLEHFTHIAAHDLREPLRQNRSLLDLFVHRVEMDDKVKMADMAAHIRKNSDKMLSMVEDFRVLTKIGQKELTREQASLESIISEALGVYRVKLEKRKVETILDNHPSDVPVYPGLALLLYTNMVNNALMHAVGDGFTLHFTAEKSKNQWILGVRNTQSDVGEGDVEKIFQMFRTGKSETGSGVGLSICRKVVDRHQGKIWVESRHQAPGHPL